LAILSDEERKVRNREYNRKYRERNKERVKQSNAAYRQRYADQIRERHREWVETHPDRNKVHKRRWYEKNRERVNRAAIEYWKNHPVEKAAHCAKRRAIIKQATPCWADTRYIRLFNILAKKESERIGRRVSVDHIVPLQSDWVCGLHCEHNLQLMFLEHNSSKHNTWTGP
jgi:hypothetical protein